MSTSFLSMKKSSSSAGLNAMVDDGFQYSLGPPESGFSIFLAERTKKVHFIRHAEGFHNAATKENGSNDVLLRGNEPAKNHALYDSRLTPKGIDQAKALRAYLANRPSGSRSFTAFDLVVVSPLTRTCETALHVFGSPREPGKPAFLCERDAPIGSPEHKAGIQVPPPRFLVREECRERWGHYVCDGRRSIREIAAEFPNFDFSEVLHDEDVFYLDEREPDDLCCERAVKFLEWLNKRPEKCIAVVTHSSFLRHLFGQFGDTLHYEDREGLQRLAGNCELRSIMLCSHGNKDGKEISPLLPTTAAPSTVRLASKSNPESLTPGMDLSVPLSM
jgi:broad specificity phosphatase PhoE